MQVEPRQPVPVVPLPGMVMFPGARIPLHIFELPYRTLVREALSGERVVALALLLSGERDSRSPPEIHPLACLARIDSVTWLPDDCYDLQIVGFARARLGRVVREFPYRAVQVTVLPQEPLSEDDPLVQMERQALIQAGTRLAGAAEAGASSRVESAGENLPFESLVNRLCMGLGAEPAEQIALLEMDSLIERGRRAREMMEARLRRASYGRSAGGEYN